MSRMRQSLESIPDQCAVLAEWSEWLGNDTATFRTAFLRKTGQDASSYPCPRECGCAHRVVKHDDGSIVAVCDCDPHRCDDITLDAADLAVYELNWQKLGRALTAALDAEMRETDSVYPARSRSPPTAIISFP